MIKVAKKKSRLVPKYTRGMSWLTFLSVFIFAGYSYGQDDGKIYQTPGVNIFDGPDEEFVLPSTGDYIPADQYNNYNLNNINDIIRRTTGVYAREEDGYGLFPNISLRGVDTLRSASVTVMEDGINIAPAPYSAPDAYYSPLSAKMHAIEIQKGSSQFRYGPHTTGGVINYVTTPVEVGQKYMLNSTYGSYNDKATHAYANYAITGGYGSLAVLGEMYYRENDGFRDFNGAVDGSGIYRKSYGSDDAGGLMQVAPMIKVLWQAPTTRDLTFELKASYNGLDYNEGYTGLTKADFNRDPYQRYVGSQLDQMNSNAITYYGKVHAELFDGIRNTTTLYYNYFSRDWFKLDKVGATGDVDSLQNVVAANYTEANDLNVLKGLVAGDLKYKSNNRKYHAYGLMNETTFDFNTTWGGMDIDHDLLVGFKAHTDKINRDQYTITYAMAAGGSLTSGGAAAFDADRNQVSEGYVGYFQEQMDFGQLKLKFGARYEYIDQVYRSGATTSEHEETHAFVPGGSLQYDWTDIKYVGGDLSIFGGVYKGFRVAGPSATRDNGKPLNPEKSVAKEIGLRYANPTFAGSLVAFHTNFENVVVIDNSNAGGTTDNGGKVRSQGLELQLNYAPVDLLSYVGVPGDIDFYFNYTWTGAHLDGDASTDDTESIFAGGRDGNNVPYIPEHQGVFGFDYGWTQFSFGANLSFHSETYGTAEQTNTEESMGVANARAGRIDHALLLNLRAGYDFNENYSLTAGVNNATDLQYISSRHPAGARAGAPLMAWVRATAKF